MVAPQQNQSVGILELIQEEQGDGFDWVVPAIHEVPNHYIPVRSDGASFLKQLEQIIELTMNVSADRDRCLNRLHIRFFEKKTFDSSANSFDGGFGEDGTAGNCLDPGVNVHYYNPNIYAKYLNLSSLSL